MTVGDQQVRVFDAHSGRVVASLRSEGLAAASFGTDSWTVTLVSADGGISHWDSRPEAALRAACRMAGRDLTEDEWKTYLPDRERKPVC